jgi:hypothetical protein
MTKEALRNKARDIYYFLPVQLVILHLRRYQLLLVFWLILVLTITGNFASNFGAASLFLAPEYLGNISFMSMLLLGGGVALFIMAWHITTFIIHAHRIPYMGAAKQTFLIYCINNSVIPLLFLVFYSIVSIHFQVYKEHTPIGRVVMLQLGFYLGYMLILLVSFAYFFRVSRDLLKVILSRIANPSKIKHIIPYDALDYEIDIVRADTYLSETLKLEHCHELDPYHPRVLKTILRKHNRNAITATIFSFLLLITLGIFMEQPLLRIPAGSSFLILFGLMMGIVGAVKHFLRSWEVLGWVVIGVLLSWLISSHIIDLRSIAYGVDYHTADNTEPSYDYHTLRNLFNTDRYQADKLTELQHLHNWKAKTGDSNAKPPLVVIMVSGGGSRSAYWTFHALQHLDSVTSGKLFKNTVLISGASGGMLGATYWRSVHDAYQDSIIKDPYNPQLRENIGKDLLNAIIFSFASVDMISPFNKISIAGYSYTKDRGYAMEQELIRNTEGLLDKKIGDFKTKEFNGDIPELIINGTIINDGRKLMMCAQPVAYLTRPEYTLEDTSAPIDAVDFATFFAKQNPYNLRITSALRMNATFPFILPVVRLPSHPRINIMDAGMRDNFGIELGARYLYVFREWIRENAGDVIFLQIRDTRKNAVTIYGSTASLGKIVMDPVFVIQEKWQAFQSYNHGHIKDLLLETFPDKIHFVDMEYHPSVELESAALNFHLTNKERKDLRASISHPENVASIDSLRRLLR